MQHAITLAEACTLLSYGFLGPLHYTQDSACAVLCTQPQCLKLTIPVRSMPNTSDLWHAMLDVVMHVHATQLSKAAEACAAAVIERLCKLTAQPTGDVA